MHDYVRHQTAVLLRRLAYQVNHAAKDAGEEAVHDLRVAIRRLNRCLRVFSQFYPGQSWKKARRRLSDLMDAAGDVRDCDIAVKLLRDAGIQPEAPIFARLAAERKQAARDLGAELRHWKQRGFSKKWRGQLGL